jgi:hypothetical protein
VLSAARGGSIRKVTANLVQSHPENTNALRHGLYSPRLLDERAREIVDALQSLDHVTALDVFALEELASCIAALETIDGELARSPKAAARKTLLERKTSLSRELRAWLREVGATPRSRWEFARALAAPTFSDLVVPRNGSGAS